MDIDYSNKSSSDNSGMSGLSSSEELNVGVNCVKVTEPYAFEPVATDSSGEDS